MEADIGHRPSLMVRSGFAAMVNDLCPTLHWHDSGVDIDFRRAWCADDSVAEVTGRASAETAFLIPWAFSRTSMLSIDAVDAPEEACGGVLWPA